MLRRVWCVAVGYCGFANWIPTLLIRQGITVTTSLMYASVIAIAAPLGPLLGLLIISYSYHAYQAELLPTSIRARAVGFVYSWSRMSAVFSAFAIAACLKHFGVNGVFVFISGAMIIVIAAIGLFGPRTRNVALEDIST
jgi:MFS transporter, putative metabolite:H+ symporter